MKGAGCKGEYYSQYFHHFQYFQYFRILSTLSVFSILKDGVFCLFVCGLEVYRIAQSSEILIGHPLSQPASVQSWESHG